MKVRYEFVTGEKTEFDVSEELGAEITVIEKSENRRERIETRRHHSLNHMDYEGAIFADNIDIGNDVEKNLDHALLHNAMDHLLPHQKDLVFKVFYEGETIESIARKEGVSGQAISNRLAKALAKMKKRFAVKE